MTGVQTCALPIYTPEAINHRLDLYDSLTAPLIDYYQGKGSLQVVDGLGTPDEVFDRLVACVQASREKP